MRTWAALASLAAASLLPVAAVPAQHDTPASGFDLNSFDTSVRPQDDLYRFVNGRWLDETPVPDDRVAHTAATELIEKTNVDIRAIIEDLSAAPDRRSGSPAQQVADLYASMLDEAAIEARGITPLLPELEAIDAVDSYRSLAERVGRMSAATTAGPFAGNVGLDPRQPADHVVTVAQGGLLLDRERYLGQDEISQGVRREYRTYLERVFTLVGRVNAAGDADAVLALETELARAHVPASPNGDPSRPAAPLTLQQLNATLPGFDWVAWGRPQGMDRVAGVTLMHPTFFKAFAALVPQRPLSTWRAWLAGRYLTAMAPNANRPLSDARFDFFGKYLTGQQAPIVRWKRGVGLVNRVLGDVVGRVYVARHFPRSSRQRVERIVDRIVRAYRDALGEADWLSSGARAEARAKLDLLKTRVGYPDIWRDYRGLEIRRDDLFGNLTRAQAFENTRRMARISRPDDRGEWMITGPQSVNAYYVPAQNEIMLPAAMLQPPYFDARADEAANYGGIGAVIGHEIAHGLDGTGRNYDGTGAKRDWWNARDEQAFLVRAQLLLDDLQRYPAIGGHDEPPINGTLAIAESLGDLAGLSMAYRGYRASLNGAPAPVIDGLSGDQRFFLAWARIWRTRERPEYRRQIVLTSRYAPADYRANGTPGHLEAFYSAFDVNQRDRLFVAPARRVRIY